MEPMKIPGVVFIMKKMKKHFSGFLIFLTAFVVGFLASPLRFTVFAVGQTDRGWFTSYESTYFKKVVLGGERCETEEEARAAFDGRVKRFSEYVEKQEILNLEENRAIISIRSEYFGEGFCIIRKEKLKVYNICSTSYGHMLEFEKQGFPKN
jgi:hypothetical protein